MKKRLLLHLLPMLVSFAGLLSPQSANSQYIGSTSPQTEQQTLATNVPCTGAAQNFNVTNLGQTYHQAFITYSVLPTNSLAVVEGIDTAGNVAVISDAMQGQPTTTGLSAILVGNGYFPQVRVQVTCSAGSNVSITYTGSSATAFAQQGASLASQVDKVLLFQAPANVNGGSQLATPPFANSLGMVYFQYNGGVGPAGSTLQVLCGGSSSNTGLPLGSLSITTFSLSTTASLQSFGIPASPCPFYEVLYNSGGASARTYNLEYLFSAISGTNGVAGSTNLTQVGGAAITLGQKTMGNSLPVAIASDQSAVPVTISGNQPTNLTQIAGVAYSEGQKTSAASAPVVLASDQSAIAVTPPSTDPCASPSVAKTSAFANVTTATTTALVAVSGSTTVYVCGFSLDISSTTASTVIFQQGTGAACAGTPTSLTSTYTNSTAVNSFKSYDGSITAFKTAASNGLCVLTTVGAAPTIGVFVTYVQQ